MLLGWRTLPHHFQKQKKLCAISVQALTDQVEDYVGSPSVLQLKGTLFGQDVLLLVDSSSTTSFVGKKLVPYLSGMTPLKMPIRVKVADDRELCCAEVILNYPWETQGHTFTTDLKVLQLGVFDLILGQDWLYDNSPMHID
jgi:hypothetical protein